VCFTGQGMQGVVDRRLAKLACQLGVYLQENSRT
jgi:hypothetical protein